MMATQKSAAALEYQPLFPSPPVTGVFNGLHPQCKHPAALSVGRCLEAGKIWKPAQEKRMR
jgi:hypothetical protein